MAAAAVVMHHIHEMYVDHTSIRSMMSTNLGDSPAGDGDRPSSCA